MGSHSECLHGDSGQGSQGGDRLSESPWELVKVPAGTPAEESAPLSPSGESDTQSGFWSVESGQLASYRVNGTWK